MRAKKHPLHVQVQQVTERMMVQHMQAVFCGGCDCLEQLAGKALT